MKLEFNINSIEDFNENLSILKAVYQKNPSEIDDFIFEYTKNYIQYLVHNIKSKNLIKILNKYNNKLNINDIIYDLSDIITDYWIYLNNFNGSNEVDSLKLVKLNKIFILREIINNMFTLD